MHSWPGAEKTHRDNFTFTKNKKKKKKKSQYLKWSLNK
jgi:hypothetical protein